MNSFHGQLVPATNLLLSPSLDGSFWKQSVTVLEQQEQFMIPGSFNSNRSTSVVSPSLLGVDQEEVDYLLVGVPIGISSIPRSPSRIGSRRMKQLVTNRMGGVEHVWWYDVARQTVSSNYSLTLILLVVSNFHIHMRPVYSSRYASWRLQYRAPPVQLQTTPDCWTFPGRTTEIARRSRIQ